MRFCWLSSCLRCYPYAEAETPPPALPVLRLSLAETDGLAQLRCCQAVELKTQTRYREQPPLPPPHFVEIVTVNETLILTF